MTHDLLTESELLFTQMCQHNRWLHLRIPVSQNPKKRRADFLVLRYFRVLAAEIKQFDATAAERRVLEQRRAGMHIAFGTEPGHRVRSAIGSGSGILRATTRGLFPGLLVVYDNTGMDYHTDSYHILTAMFGLEAAVLARQPETRWRLRLSHYKFAGKRKTTPSDNRAISAIARIYRGPEGEPRLDCFHNPFAAVKMPPEKWSGRTVRHFVLTDEDGQQRREWIEVGPNKSL